MKFIKLLLVLNIVLWGVLMVLRMLEIIHWSGLLVSMPLLVDELAVLIIVFTWRGWHS